jgi:excisionase family DNA binding protein
MASGKATRHTTDYIKMGNRKQPTTDYEASSRTGEDFKPHHRGNIEIVTVNEVSELLKVSKWMVYELVKQNEIPHFKVGRSVRFIKGEVVRWMLL